MFPSKDAESELGRTYRVTTHLIRYEVPKSVKSKNTQESNDQIFQPLLMLLDQLRKAIEDYLGDLEKQQQQKRDTGQTDTVSGLVNEI